MPNSHALEVMTASGMATWQTPQSFLELVRKVAPIALDPCTAEDNPTGALSWAWAPKYGGLALNWTPYTENFGLAFVNPPYGRALPEWANKIACEGICGVQQIVLVPCRPDVAWYAELCHSASMRLEWRGRITFVDPRAPKGMQWSEKKGCFVKAQPAAFPVAVFYYAGSSGSTKRFMDVFDGKGRFCQDIRRAA